MDHRAALGGTTTATLNPSNLKFAAGARPPGGIVLLTSMLSARRYHDEIRAEFVRASRIGAAVVAAVALTAIGLALVARSSLQSGFGPAEIAGVALAALAAIGLLYIVYRQGKRLAAQAHGLVAQQEIVEDQATRLEEQAAKLEEQTKELAASNAELAAALQERERARLRAEAVAEQKTRVAALLDAVLASAPVGFGFFDDQLRFLRVNPTLARINGAPLEEHIGKSLREINPRLAEAVDPLLRRVLATRQAIVNLEIATDATSTDGALRHWLASYYPIFAQPDEVVGIGVTIADVTDRKTLEAQLIQAQKMEAVGRLAGGVAHDFNNLLTVISSYAELMLAGEDPESRQDSVIEIRDAATRAAGLTRQLLAFSRKQILEPKVVSLNDVVRGLHGMLRRLLFENISIVTALTPDSTLVRIDRGQLEQVLMNLAINASDAMPEGGRLTIETRAVVVTDEIARTDPELAPGSYVRIGVTDTGHGMDPSTLAMIFEPFFTTKEPGRGTGLGLSTVYGIVKQSAGHITVKSEVGIGTQFLIYLPSASD